jgi:hypothetical protein
MVSAPAHFLRPPRLRLGEHLLEQIAGAPHGPAAQALGVLLQFVVIRHAGIGGDGQHLVRPVLAPSMRSQAVMAATAAL